jgi:hypothetical protein
MKSLKVSVTAGRFTSSRGKTVDGKKRHGDAAIALALAYYATVMPIAEYDYTSGKAPDPREERRREDHVRPVKVTAGFSERQGVL